MALASHYSLPVAIVPLARLEAPTTIGEGSKLDEFTGLGG
jgi:hypothetical protein